jgi:arylsulfatase A-like enzyme
VGAVVQVACRNVYDVGAVSAGAGVTALVLCAFYVLPPALMLLEVGKWLPGLATAAYPVGIMGVVWINARYSLRKELAGIESRVSWGVLLPALALALSLLSGLGMSWQKYGSKAALEGDPNVLWVTVDTLRRDHVGAYGTAGAGTPHMDALAASGIRFDNAVTPSPETAPAHASMLTGLHPLRHGLLGNGGQLARGIPTLAEVLEQEGYATGAFLSAVALGAETGLDRGFEVYDADLGPIRGISELWPVKVFVRLLFRLGHPERFAWLLERSGERTLSIAADWIGDRESQPWFAWVHLFAPHAPYEAEGGLDHRALIADPNHAYTEEERQQLRVQYRAEVQRVDAQVGRLLAAVASTADRTIVVLTADHGEQLGEHGIDFHHRGLFDEVIRVPLFLRAPGLQPGVVSQQVRLMDLLPTMLELIHLEGPKRSEGGSLLELVDGRREVAMSCTLLGRTPDGKGRLLGLRTAEAKLIVDPDSGERALFDLVRDPGETRDVSSEQVDALEQARTLVDREIRAWRGMAPRLDRAADERLKALGYVQ